MPSNGFFVAAADQSHQSQIVHLRLAKSTGTSGKQRSGGNGCRMPGCFDPDPGKTYKSLIRGRTEQQEAEASTGYDFDQDQKLPEVPPAFEDTTQGLPTAQHSLAPRIDEGDKSGKKNYSVPGVYRDENGKLHAVFHTVSPTPVTTPPSEHVVSHAPSNTAGTLVLRASTNVTGADVQYTVDKYPEDYPFDVVFEILELKHDAYRQIFDQDKRTEELVTRIDSPSDPYLCSSTVKAEYPTYDKSTKAYIVNVENYYQSVTYERCDTPNAVCSNVHPSKGGRLYCEQVYGEYEVLTVPKDGSKRFVKTKLKFPSCCKCRHEAAP
ncbi:AGAP000346-PA-like protein [Anopheles sinensis]|uniref:AGAP000346-PA-like protein n=1 Tax=Anopheles sinensis TaxID=74873 RepID=A0A084VN45_ANOSI|nr:AGAP000346-PA-like protein [Anopheles sinensis]